MKDIQMQADSIAKECHRKPIILVFVSILCLLTIGVIIFAVLRVAESVRVEPSFTARIGGPVVAEDLLDFFDLIQHDASDESVLAFVASHPAVLSKQMPGLGTPLHHASVRARLELVSDLLNRGADPAQRTPSDAYMPSRIVAAAVGDEHVPEFFTPLDAAVIDNDEAFIAFLIQQDALDRGDAAWKSALELANRLSRRPIAEMIERHRESN